ncbi:hypothetical protein QBC47DRAFT_432257 [Echria macrotheca]|uniref:Uncharacterized protein n=1 Tax=Echria macrotheca TaxID=438768 RepID=A0AAJ0BB22_9PEZI|nr:hypothetical protein QBC47DRAFT_432257 [Echria macrotheca]
MTSRHPLPAAPGAPPPPIPALRCQFPSQDEFPSASQAPATLPFGALTPPPPEFHILDESPVLPLPCPRQLTEALKPRSDAVPAVFVETEVYADPRQSLGRAHIIDIDKFSSRTDLRSFRLCDAVTTVLHCLNPKLAAAIEHDAVNMGTMDFVFRDMRLGWSARENTVVTFEMSRHPGENGRRTRTEATLYPFQRTKSVKYNATFDAETGTYWPDSAAHGFSYTEENSVRTETRDRALVELYGSYIGSCLLLGGFHRRTPYNYLDIKRNGDPVYPDWPDEKVTPEADMLRRGIYNRWETVGDRNDAARRLFQGSVAKPKLPVHDLVGWSERRKAAREEAKARGRAGEVSRGRGYSVSWEKGYPVFDVRQGAGHGMVGSVLAGDVGSGERTELGLSDSIRDSLDWEPRHDRGSITRDDTKMIELLEALKKSPGTKQGVDPHLEDGPRQLPHFPPKPRRIKPVYCCRYCYEVGKVLKNWSLW